MSRMSTFAIRAAVAGVVFYMTAPLLSQAIEVQHFASLSDESIVAENRGMGLAFRLDMATWLELSMEYSQTTSESVREGIGCGMINREMVGCEQATVDDRVTLRGLRAILKPTVLGGSLGHLRGRIGFSGTVPDVVSESRVYDELRDRQKIGNTFASRGAHLGLMSGAELELRPLQRIPVGVKAGAALHRVFFDDCHTNPNMHTPFCGPIDFREWHLGAVVHLPRSHH
jgi:hypothetical protein